MSGSQKRAADHEGRPDNLASQADGQNPEDGFGDYGASPAERQEIIEHIESVVSSSQGDVGADGFAVKARKSGFVLPLVVNLAALAIIAAGSLLLFRTLSRQETTAVVEATSLSSAQGLLLRQFREESDALLLEKEGEIQNIQGELQRIASERESLAAAMERQLAEQADTLRSQFETDLAAERERLRDQSLSEDEIERQLAAFQSAEQTRYEEGLAQLRSQAEAELAARGAALEAQTREAQRTLANAQLEREAIESGLREERDETLALLADLQSRQAQERLISGRITSLYGTIQAAIEAGNLGEALEGTAELREYLSSEPVLALPAIERRRAVELFLVDSLERQILDEQVASAPDGETLEATVMLVARVTSLVNEAEFAFGSADINAARTLYLSAMSEIPAVKVGYERLEEIARRAEERESARLAELIRRGNNLYRSGLYREATEAYGLAVSSLPADDTELLSRILDAGYQLRRGEDLSALRAVQAELEAAKRETAARDATIDDREEVIARLQEEAKDQRAIIAGLRAELDVALNQPAVVETRTDPQQAARISTLETEISRAQSEIDRLESRITTLTGSLESTRSQATDLRNQLQAMSGVRAFYDSQETLAQKISQYRRRVGTTASAPSAIPTTLDLLETKLIIIRVLESSSVRAQYPGLAQRLEEYLDALITEQRSESSAETMQNVNAVLEFIMEESTTVTTGDVPPAPGGAGAESSRFLGLLESLAGPQ